MGKNKDLLKELNYLTTDASAKLSIQNYDSQFVHLFELRTPFIIVIETCNEENDFYSLYRLSIDEHSCHVLDKQEHSKFLNRPPHQHSFIEIMLVLSGEITHYIEHHPFTYRAGDCVILNRNILDAELLLGNFQAVFLDFQESFVDTMISDELSAYKNSSSVYRQYLQSPIIKMLRSTQDAKSQYQKTYFECLPVVDSEIVVDKMTQIINSIILELSNDGPGSLYMIKGFFQKFLSVLCDPTLYSVISISSTLSKQRFLVEEVKHIIESKHGKVSRQELAEQLHYNEEYLNRIIKKYTGKTLSQYRQHIMLQEAQKLLTTSDMNVSEIIAHLDLSNRSFFYQIFQKEFGLSPLEYRRQHKKIT